MKILLLFGSCLILSATGREIERVEGLGEARGFSAKFFHGLSNRGNRRIDEDDEDIEGRFFLQDKLCSLGLAECDDSVRIKYVQPVKVVPIGQPVPESEIGDYPHIPAQVVKDIYEDLSGSDYHLQSEHSAKPSYKPPAFHSHNPEFSPSYTPPKPVYSPPKHQTGTIPTYEAQKSTYKDPKPSYESAKPTYQVPNPSYEAPKPSYEAPKPSYESPKPSYETPNPAYNAPKPTYTAPKPVYSPPKPTYNPPKPSYTSPVAYEPPVIIDAKSTAEHTYHHQGHTTGQRVDVAIDDSAFTTNFGSGTQLTGLFRPSSECVCVPVGQCPTGKIFTPLEKDYSSLINPRREPSPQSITAASRRNKSRSLKFAEEKSKDDQSVESVEESVEEEETHLEQDSTVTVERKRRASPDIFPSRAARLEYTYVPEEQLGHDTQTETEVEQSDDNQTETDASDDIQTVTDLPEEDLAVAGEVEDDDVTGQEAEGRGEATELPYAIESRDTDIDIVSELKEKLKEERKKERIKNRRKKHKKNKVTSPPPQESEPEEYDHEGEDKSFDSLSSFTEDVSDKVGNVGSSVTSGVTRIFGGLTDLIGTSTANGQLKPTIGVSFGLPQGGPGYGGYPTNPVNTGGAVNPYYTAQNGVELGPVNLNPLVSLQTGTTDDGELAVKPLVNLHLTPNGCGILGCHEYDEYGNPSLTKKIADALTNPFGIFDKDDEKYHAISAEYTPPGYYPPSGGYEAPGSNYGTSSSIGYGSSSGSGYGVPVVHPQTGYGPPNVDSGYGAPQPSYSAPSEGYGVPTYNPAQDDYIAPSTGYNPPQANLFKHGHTHSGHTHSASGHSHTGDHGSDYSNQGSTHIHHHYHHGENNYLREQPISNRNFTADLYGYEDSDVFKRETVIPNSSGSLPGNLPSGAVKVDTASAKVSVQGSGSGFKFPNSRKIDLQNQRKKRQPLVQVDREPHSLEVNEDNLLALANQLSTQEYEKFGSPTCGGAGSGYVCCSFR